MKIWAGFGLFLVALTSFIVALFGFKAQAAIYVNSGPQYGIYSTQWTARAQRFETLENLINTTELNTVVIDVKENGVYLDRYIKGVVWELRRKGVYVVARVVVFQDNSQIKKHPEWYFKKRDGTLWQDKRGWFWLNPLVTQTWDYNLAVAKRISDFGFDEINFDYIRYPAFSKDDDVVVASSSRPLIKHKVIDEFSRYITARLREHNPAVKLSVDLFAYSMLRLDDLGVGQVFVTLFDYFDYVSPMIYPSHYTSGNFGFKNPAQYPYEVVFSTIESGKTQLYNKVISDLATTAPTFVRPVFQEKLKKLRPWLQDFNLGSIYNAHMVRQQKQAVYDSGLTAGWLFWNPRSVYTQGALDKN